MVGMNELQAIKWVQDQPGLKMEVKKGREITITDGVNVEYTGIGILDTVVEIQKILKNMKQIKITLANC